MTCMREDVNNEIFSSMTYFMFPLEQHFVTNGGWWSVVIELFWYTSSVLLMATQNTCP